MRRSEAEPLHQQPPLVLQAAGFADRPPFLQVARATGSRQGGARRWPRPLGKPRPQPPARHVIGHRIGRLAGRLLPGRGGAGGAEEAGPESGRQGGGFGEGHGGVGVRRPGDGPIRSREGVDLSVEHVVPQDVREDGRAPAGLGDDGEPLGRAEGNGRRLGPRIAGLGEVRAAEEGSGAAGEHVVVLQVGEGVLGPRRGLALAPNEPRNRGGVELSGAFGVREDRERRGGSVRGREGAAGRERGRGRGREMDRDRERGRWREREQKRALSAREAGTQSAEMQMKKKMAAYSSCLVK